jgi:hypothetical protein
MGSLCLQLQTTPDRVLFRLHRLLLILENELIAENVYDLVLDAMSTLRLIKPSDDLQSLQSATNDECKSSDGGTST